jgi:DNA-binding transcriptional MocR family regulator
MLPGKMRDEEIVKMAAREKLWLWPLSRTYHGPASQGFILGFGSTPTKTIPDAVRHLRRLIRSYLP